MRSGLPTPGKPSGAHELDHRGDHQRVVGHAHHILERGHQVLQRGGEARRRLDLLHACCLCRHRGAFHHGSHRVSSAQATAPLYALPSHACARQWSGRRGAGGYPRLGASPARESVMFPVPVPALTLWVSPGHPNRDTNSVPPVSLARDVV